MGFLQPSRSAPSGSLLLSALLFAPAAPAQAQDVAAPAHIAYLDGGATLERDGVAQTASGSMPLLPGDRLLTTTGRVEVLFPDGSALDVDEYTTVDLQSPTLFRLTSGRVLLVVAGASDPANAVLYQIDTPVASVTSEGPGEYRIALLTGPAGSETELAVFRGSATLVTERGATRVVAGERSLAHDFGVPSYPLRFNSARFDAFDRWSAARRDARIGTASARHLPRELYVYGGALDRYGAWHYEASHGYVWYPTVAADWRPYFYGYWSPIRHYGWTWIGADFWAWPTHHYGRWGVRHGRWFWIPDRYWAPAWVAWAAAPGFVGWAPLGFSGAPVFALSVTIGNPWAGWVVVPHRHFGRHGLPVSQFAVAGSQLPRHAPLITQATAPVPVPRAVSRPGQASEAVAVPRGRAVPRTNALDSAVLGTPSTTRQAEAPVRQAAPGVDRRPTAGRPATAAAPTALARRPLPDAGRRSASTPGVRQETTPGEAGGPRSVGRPAPLAGNPPALRERAGATRATRATTFGSAPEPQTPTGGTETSRFRRAEPAPRPQAEPRPRSRPSVSRPESAQPLVVPRATPRTAPSWPAQPTTGAPSRAAEPPAPAVLSRPASRTPPARPAGALRAAPPSSAAPAAPPPRARTRAVPRAAPPATAAPPTAPSSAAPARQAPRAREAPPRGPAARRGS